MELRQLRYFLKAKELLNFTEAAHSLYISQSTLSQQIKHLEDELGVPLFDRIGKRIVLTEAGRLFADYAMQSVHQADNGLQILQDLNNMDIGEIRIGLTYGLKPIFTPALIRFMTKYPKMKLQVVLGTSQELLERLTNFEFDFLLSFLISEKEKHFNYQLLFQSPMALVMAKKSPLSAKKKITMEEISELPLALPAKGYSTREFITEVFRQRGLSPEISLEINDIPTLLDVVKTGNWYSILSQFSISKKDEVASVPIQGVNTQRRAMIISLKGSYEKKSVKAFYEFIKAASENLS